MADGSLRFFPMAKILVRSRYFSGPLEVIVMRNMPHQLIIGNVIGSNADFPPNQAEEPQTPLTPQVEALDNTAASQDGSALAGHRADRVDDTTVEVDHLVSGAGGETAPPLAQETENPVRDQRQSQDGVVGAITRAAARKNGQANAPVNLPDFGALDKTVAEVRSLQEQDPTLTKLWAKVGVPPGDCFEKYQHAYINKNGLLYRRCRAASGLIPTEATQLVVPKILRDKVLEVAHNSILGCHMASRRTLARIETSFYWPGINSDVKRYCMSCDTCQRTVAKGTVRRAPMLFSQLAELPFEHMYVDLIGEIVPPSARGHRYILTMIDGCSRYPYACALKRITTETVVEALLGFWSHTGFPQKVTSDNGSQFVSELMEQVLKTLGIKHIRASPYHAQANGVCENFNKSLKTMLKRLCIEKVRDWDKFVDPCLFAYRETLTPVRGTPHLSSPRDATPRDQ